MITQSEFKLVQSLLNKKDKTRERDLEFEYKGIFKCGCCNAMLTAERKTKFNVEDQSERSYDYYRCVHRKLSTQCKEKPLAKTCIESQVLFELNKASLPNEVLDFGIDKLGEQKGQETQLQATTSFNIKREIQTLNRQKNQLEDNLVLESDAEIRAMMKRKYEEIKINLQKLDEDYQQLQKEIENNHFTIIEALKVLKNAKTALEFGTNEQKRSVFEHIGTNWNIQDKKVHYKPNFVVKAVMKTKDYINSKKSRIEPNKTQSRTRQTLCHEDVTFIWYTLWEFIKNSEE